MGRIIKTVLLRRVKRFPVSLRGAAATKQSKFFVTVTFVAVTLGSLGFISCAQAEVATVRNPLIWRQDNLGTYILPEKIEKDLYAVDDFAATGGQIKSITVNWEAAGKIAFEVSADNGMHFNPVVNGVPLTSGFVSGNRLRWRAQALTEDAKLSSVKISYTDTAGVLGTFGEPALSGFKYRKPIFIKNSWDQDLYNYQIKLKIGENESVKAVDLNCAGRIQADFKDIRFTAADGETPLPYYLETLEGSAPKRVAEVWVKVPQIPKSGVTVYLYYSNVDAQDLSNPDKTFDFFEDFQDVPLDNEKWKAYVDQKGSYVLSEGRIKLDAAEIVTRDFQFKEGIIEYGCELESGFENSMNIRSKNNKSFNNPDWSVYSSIYKGAEHCVAVDGIVKANDAIARPIVMRGKYNYRVNLTAGKITFERFEIAGAAGGSLAMAEPKASAAYQAAAEPKPGYLGLRSGGDGGGKNNVYFNSIRVRKAAAVLPSVENAGDEEAVVLPVFVNIILSEKGNLILKSEAQSGYYLLRDIVSGVPVNIIIANWEMPPGDKTTLSVGVSADNGLTYKKPCEKGKFYYAFKKDFSSGINLKARIDFSLPNTADSIGGISVFSLDYRPGMINLISPNNKEEWEVGTKKKISWSALDYELSYPFDIAYSIDKGKTYIDIVTKKENDGVYFWTIPDKVSKTVKVKVSNALDKNIYDTSVAFFSIIANESGAGEAQNQLVPEEKTEVIPPEKPKEEEEVKKTKKPLNIKLYDLLIKIGDNVASTPEVDKRASYKEGDIVMIKPAGYVWGVEERSNFLIIQTYLTERLAAELMSPKKTADGKMINRRKYKIDLRKQGLKTFWGGIGKPKSVMDVSIVEEKKAPAAGMEMK